MAAMKPHLKLKEKLMLLELALYAKNVSAACAYMGVSRKSYYRIKKAYDEGGVEALAKKSRKVPNLKNRIPKKVEKAILKLSIEDPSLGKKRMSKVLKVKEIEVSPTGVRNVWVRHDLETINDRVKAMMEHVNKAGKDLTKVQMKALEKFIGS